MYSIKSDGKGGAFLTKENKTIAVFQYYIDAKELLDSKTTSKTPFTGKLEGTLNIDYANADILCDMVAKETNTAGPYMCGTNSQSKPAIFKNNMEIAVFESLGLAMEATYLLNQQDKVDH